jgi:hypothetical protein
VEFAAGVDSTLLVDGFRFTGGVARLLSTPDGYYGGGVLCSDASPHLRDCEFDGNVAGSDLQFGGGGGAFFANSRARLTRCRFVGNQATRGAGLYGYQGALQMEECRIEANALHQSTGTRGGGVYLEGGSLRYQGGHLSRNGQAEEGGALFARAATVQLEALRIERNAARTGGALALLEGTALSMRGSLVHGNLATHLGSGIYALGSMAEVVNVTFDANQGSGGCIVTQNASAPWTLRNDLFVSHDSIALFFFSTPVDLDYNLYWNNQGGDVQGAPLGPHALQTDPLYANAAAHDFAPGLHSPALDSGDPAVQDGDGSRSDRGAFGGPHGRSRAPAVPQLHAARLIDGSTSIAWSANEETDVLTYALYRSTDSSFVPAASNVLALVGAKQTAASDAGGEAGSWYRLAAVDSSGASSGFSVAVPAVPTALPLPRSGSLEPRQALPAQPAPEAPSALALYPSEPNPANPGTRIRFDLPWRGPARLVLFDVRGRSLRTWMHDQGEPGSFQIHWDGRDDAGREVPTGVYWVSLQAGSERSVRKLTLLR